MNAAQQMKIEKKASFRKAPEFCFSGASNQAEIERFFQHIAIVMTA